MQQITFWSLNLNSNFSVGKAEITNWAKGGPMAPVTPEAPEASYSLCVSRFLFENMHHWSRISIEICKVGAALSGGLFL